ncbi:AIR carboxylase family protein, partial [Lacticaseibacillus rhamnosus]
MALALSPLPDVHPPAVFAPKPMSTPAASTGSPAGGAAHLPGMVASMTTLPVLGVPIEGKSLAGADSLYSIVQMPAGIPVGTLAIGRSGA